MAPKKKAEEVQEETQESPPPTPPPEPEPELPLAPILQRLGWSREKMAQSGKTFFWHEKTAIIQPGAPYYEVLGMDPAGYEQHTKSQIKAAWFVHKVKVRPLIEKDEEAARDWAIITEAFDVLKDPSHRNSYEQENLSRSARQINTGLFAGFRVQRCAAEKARLEEEERLAAEQQAALDAAQEPVAA